MKAEIDGEMVEVRSIPLSDCKEGDVMVIKTDLCMSADAEERMREAISRVVDGRLKVLILCDGMDLEIVRIAQ